MRLDAVDRMILEQLQQCGRLKNKELAKRIGLSPSACHSRVRRLEEGGAIAGYVAIVDSAALGAHFEAWAEIKLSDRAAASVSRFRSLLDVTPEVAAAYQLAGAFDFLLHFIAPSVDAWKHFCAHTDSMGVAEARLSVVIDTPKTSAPIRSPLARAQFRLKLV